MNGIENYIEQILSAYDNLIKEKHPGDPDTRYRSWEWCRKAFLEGKKEYWKKGTTDKKKKEIIDYLALHLGFYLASWGMYRGSSFLLKRDYKTHIRVVELILDKRYQILWNIDYSSLKGKDIDNICDLIFNKPDGISHRIKEIYKKKKDFFVDLDDEKEDIPSDTLVSKLLLGTFGCVPAFDSLLTQGISAFKKTGFYKTEKISGKTLPQCFNEKSYKWLVSFAVKYNTIIEKWTRKGYTPMKCIDMFFWQIGLEKQYAEYLENKADLEKNEKKEKRIIKIVRKMKICKENNRSDIIAEIKKHYTGANC